MIFGYFTDTHVRGDNPDARTDDFRKSIFTKLEEIGEIWSTNGVDCVLFGGDLFHTPEPVNSLKYDLMSILKNWNIRIIGVIGSHDYFGYQIKSLKRTAIGLFEKSGIIELVGNVGESTNPIINMSHDKITIVGTPHTYWLCDDVNNFYSKKIFNDHFQIQLVHGDLLDKPVPWQHVSCKDVKTESDLILSGHYHPGWKNPLPIGGTTFINPGSIGRIENSSRIRIPRVCIINSMNKEIKFVGLNSCEQHPFKEKFDEEEHNIMQDVTKLLNMIEHTEIDFVNVKEQLPPIAKELGFSDKVLEISFEFLENATHV